MSRTVLAALALVPWLVASTAVGAEPAATDLEYSVAEGSDGCPDEAAFRQWVARRLGRDPFVSGAAHKVQVSLARSGALLVARVRVEEDGVARGERRIESRAGCAELAAGAALAVSIAIDPEAALNGAGTPAASSSAPAAEPPAPAEPLATAEPPATTEPPAPAKPPAPVAPLRSAPRDRAVVPAAPAHAPLRTFVRVGARAMSGVVPGLDVGPSLGLGQQLGMWSLAVDGVLMPARSEHASGAERSVSVSALFAELSPCAHFLRLRACGLLALGALLARGEGVDEPRVDRSWYAAAGVGLGYAIPFGRFSLTPSAELAAHLGKTALSLDAQPVWTTPRGVAGLGLELSYELSAPP